MFNINLKQRAVRQLKKLKPYYAAQILDGIESLTEDDMEDYLLERSEKFWKMIERARKGKSVSLETLRKQLKV